MSLLLICDAPGCVQSIPAVVKLGKAAAPDGWWMQVASNGQLVVGCCDAHLNLAAKSKS